MIPNAKAKLQKKLKNSVDFGADNIDNTAPVKKILDDLQHKNIQAFAYYCQTLRPRRTTKESYNFHHTLTGHPLHAFPDDWEGDLNSGFFEPFQYKSMMPRIVTPVRNTDKNDPVANILKVKSEWLSESKNLRHVAVTKSMTDKYYSLNEEVIQCPKHLVDIAAHIDSDPDIYFDDSYNWYYAGCGNMQLICLDWVDYLLCSEFNTLYLYLFSKHELSIRPDQVATYDCGEVNMIMETICSAHNLIALRTKYKIFILKIVPDGDRLKFEKIKSVETELPFTGISFDNHHKNILYITSLDNKVTIVNLDRLTGRKIQLKIRTNTLVNNWNRVISSDRITYTHVTKNSIIFYDKRTNNIVQEWSNIRDVTDHLGCDSISVARQREGSTNLYCATDHHMFLLDMRHQKKLKPQPTLRWTHGMQCVPVYMSECNFEFNKELICLSSQWCEDSCVIPSYICETRKEGEIAGITIPYRPPSILSTLKGAREKLLCFDFYNPIDQRLSTSITGQVVLEHNENFAILTQNALGDITCHTLFPEHMESFIDDYSIEYLQNWCKSFKVPDKPFEVSAVKDISHVWRQLEKVPSQHKFTQREDEIKHHLDKIKKEINNAFDKGELDQGLFDIWNEANNTTTVEERSSLALNLHYSDEDFSLCEN